MCVCVLAEEAGDFLRLSQNQFAAFSSSKSELNFFFSTLIVHKRRHHFWGCQMMIFWGKPNDDALYRKLILHVVTETKMMILRGKEMFRRQENLIDFHQTIL